MIRRIYRVPSHVLATTAEEVPVPTTRILSNQIGQLCQDLLETMYACEAAGCAAPQVGLALRAFAVVQGVLDPRYPSLVINPEIFPLGKAETVGWEGCLSLPGGPLVQVRRAARVRIRCLLARVFRADDYAWVVETQALECEVEGPPARVLQHEDDHLHGVCISDRAGLAQAARFTRALRRLRWDRTFAPPGCEEPPPEKEIAQ